MVLIPRLRIECRLHGRERVIPLHIFEVWIILRRMTRLDHVESEPVFVMQTLRRTALSLRMKRHEVPAGIALADAPRHLAPNRLYPVRISITAQNPNDI